LHVNRLEEVDDNYLVLDEKGSISFATIGKGLAGCFTLSLETRVISTLLCFP